jgi:hypothetical protein
MRSSRYQPKHAKPSLHPTRSTMSAGLTAVLLPLCLTTPAFAEGEASASPTAATSTATVVPSAQPTSMRISGPEGGVSPGSHAIAVRLVDADGQYVAGESVEVQRWAGQAWQALGRVQTDAMGLAKQQFSFSATTKVRAVYAGSVYRGASVSPERTVLVGQKTSLRISGPTGAVSAGSHPVAVRLLADGAYVPNAYVRVERQTASGWEYLGKMITDGGGHAKQSFAFPTTTKVRAVYEGSATRTARSPGADGRVATFRRARWRRARSRTASPTATARSAPTASTAPVWSSTPSPRPARRCPAPAARCTAPPSASAPRRSSPATSSS